MNVIVHYPEDKKLLEELFKNKAKLHADMVISYINKLPYSKAEKISIIDYIIQNKIEN